MLGGDQTITISARTRMRVDAADAFAFLASPCNHRRLQVVGIRLLALDDERGGGLAGGVFALEGPAGIRRIARTRVTLCQPPHRLAGSARLDSGTEAHVSWTLRPAGEHAVDVELTAVLGPIAAGDRLALALGGRRWARDRFTRTLHRLAGEVQHAPLAICSARRAPAGRAAGHGITQLA
jgi:Polyketide cyclase / dehydrase and lipid transport